MCASLRSACIWSHITTGYFSVRYTSRWYCCLTKNDSYIDIYRAIFSAWFNPPESDLLLINMLIRVTRIQPSTPADKPAIDASLVATLYFWYKFNAHFPSCLWDSCFLHGLIIQIHAVTKTAAGTVDHVQIAWASEDIRMQEYFDFHSHYLDVLAGLWEIQFGLISVGLTCLLAF